MNFYIIFPFFLSMYMNFFPSHLTSSFLLITSLLSTVYSETVWNSPISLSPTSDWGTGLCGNIIFINPSASLYVHSFIVSMEIYHGDITSSWGDGLSSVVTYQDSTSKIFHFQAENILIGPGQIFSAIGLCISNQLDFDLKRNVFLGVDLFPGNTLNCSGLECSLTCGDGLCATCESETNCPIDCIPNQGVVYAPLVWTGIVSVEVTSSSWGSICGNIYVQNPSATATAKSYVLTLLSCAKTAKLTSLWGSDEEMVVSTSVFNTFRQVANNQLYEPQKNYNVGGFCLYVTDSFDMNKHFKIGVDLIDKNNLCTPATCQPVCGDGICNGDETTSNCTPDCAPLSCIA